MDRILIHELHNILHCSRFTFIFLIKTQAHRASSFGQIFLREMTSTKKPSRSYISLS